MGHIRYARVVSPEAFDDVNHYYPKVRNANIHPLVKYFLNLSNRRIIDRYCRLHPEVDSEALRDLLNYKPTYFRWAGADLFPVATEEGNRKMVLIETNSCPSGQKSMPLFDDTQEMGGYQILLKNAFLPLLEQNLPEGSLAVIFDKNGMENSGYAATLAELTGEKIYLVEWHHHDKDPPAKFVDGLLFVRLDNEEWVPIRAAFRYVTQKPWKLIPVKTKTLLFNPILCCLSGGRNKLVAAKAYDFFNGELEGTGLEIRAPETNLDISKNEVRFWIRRMNNVGVIKVPYSNAGQGVYTITSEEELDLFMSDSYEYDIFIVQSLIGNSNWSSLVKHGKYFHIGTVPDRKNNFYAVDLRMMIYSSDSGFRPVATYARRAKEPLLDKLEPHYKSWDMLGTNLSFKREDGSWDTDTDRLLLMDTRDFNRLGIGLDDLIEAFIQTVLAAISIDKMAKMLVSDEGNFRINLFRSLDPDNSLIEEILVD